VDCAHQVFRIKRVQPWTLWLAIINIEDKRARERAARRQETGKCSDQPARMVEGQRVMGWRDALNELDTA
jgi:putative transposase